MARIKKVKKTDSPAGAKKDTNLVRRVTTRKTNKGIVQFGTGDTVNVSVKVKEGEKERVQIFKGLVTKVQGSGSSRSFTVRKISAGVGVERTFPFASPVVEKVELIAHGNVRRARLFYLRELEGKAAKITSELAAPVAASSTTED